MTHTKPSTLRSIIIGIALTVNSVAASATANYLFTETIGGHYLSLSFAGTLSANEVDVTYVSSISIDNRSWTGYPPVFTGFQFKPFDSKYPAVIGTTPHGISNLYVTLDGATYLAWSPAPATTIIHAPVTAGIDASYLNSTSTNWHVSAVPEPDEYAMMLLGFGMAGYQVKRKQKRKSAPLAA